MNSEPVLGLARRLVPDLPTAEKRSSSKQTGLQLHCKQLPGPIGTGSPPLSLASFLIQALGTYDATAGNGAEVAPDPRLGTAEDVPHFEADLQR